MFAGVDEVGRGPLAGAVVAAAVILEVPIAGVKDSKLLSDKKRRILAESIQQNALCFAYGRAEVSEIDAINIHQASLLAMQRAVQGLTIRPHILRVDGRFGPDVNIPVETYIGGDRYIYEISAASILAKVLRDDEMIQWDRQYPGYGFAKNKGYATQDHRDALYALGPCPIHRRSFAPVKNMYQ